MSRLDKIKYYQKGRTAPLFGVGFMEELERTWNRPWGAQTHTGRLEMVLLHRPGEENDAPEIREDPAFFNLPEGLPDWRIMQREHDAFADVLRSEGVEVVYLEPDAPLVGTYGVSLRALVYARTATVIRGGAIMDRNANHYKRGMERFYTKRLANLGCPILYTVHGMGSFEASDLIFVSPSCAIIGKSMRTNQEGIDQVVPILRQNGVEDILFTDVPGYWHRREAQWGGASGYFHLDAIFGMAAENLAVVYPGGVGYHLLEELNSRGIEIIEVPDAEVHMLAPNLLVIKPGTVVIPGRQPGNRGGGCGRSRSRSTRPTSPNSSKRAVGRSASAWR